MNPTEALPCKLQGYDVTTRGLEYARSALRDGQRLGRALEHLPFNGPVTTYLRHGLRDDEIFDFDDGGVASVEESNACLASEIIRHLGATARPGPLAIFETAAWPGAPFTARWESDYLRVESEVYIYALHSTDSRGVMQAIREGGSFPYVAALSYLPEGVSITRGGELSPNELDDIARLTARILLKAYDSESWLIVDTDHHNLASHPASP